MKPLSMFNKEDEGKYINEYVAQISFTNKKVIAHGKDIKKVFNEAKKIIDEPVIFYAIDPNKDYIFWGG